ncbi:hypothetical protein ACFL0H_13055, partial [Thermodesulfobacteriota bacterium]
ISSFRDSHSLPWFVDPYGARPKPGPSGSVIYCFDGEFWNFETVSRGGSARYINSVLCPIRG